MHQIQEIQKFGATRDGKRSMHYAERLKYNGTDLAALAGVPGPESGEIHVHAEAPDGLGGGRYWMDDWTIFYWGWWIAWAPFVGMFIAKISRGRTVRQIITGAMIGMLSASLQYSM